MHENQTEKTMDAIEEYNYWGYPDKSIDWTQKQGMQLLRRIPFIVSVDEEKEKNVE